MAISSIGSPSYAQAPVAAPAAASAKPDTDAPTAAAAKSAAAPDTDAGSEKSASAPAAPVNMMKINPDGTVGPMHLHRHPNSPGVVHA